MVIGFYKGRKVALYRILGSKLWQFAVFFLFGLRVKDIDCGFKMVKRKVLQKIPHLKSQRGAMINAEIVIKAKKAGFKVQEDTLQLGKVVNCNATLSGRYLFRNPAKPIVKRGRNIKGDSVKIRQIIDTIFDTFPPEIEWEPMQYRDQIADIVAQRIKSNVIFETDAHAKCDCLY